MWYTNWDREMENILRDLVPENGSNQKKMPPELELLFFANTFPLAFHYALALRSMGWTPGEYIKLGGWDESPGSINRKNIKKRQQERLIWYTNEQEFPDEQKEQVTIFSPKWAFAPMSLSLYRIYDSLKRNNWKSDESGMHEQQTEEEVGLIEFLVAARKKGYAELWIYAELCELGELIQKYVRNYANSEYPDAKMFFATPMESGRNNAFRLPVFEQLEEPRNLLRLFIYGGSLSSYLRRKSNRYVRLRLPELDTPEEKMTTYIATNGPKEWLNTLGKYHEALYARATERSCKDIEAADFENHMPENCPPFYAIYRRYNELAWLLQHRSSFENADQYARCLNEHHISKIESGASTK